MYTCFDFIKIEKNPHVWTFISQHLVALLGYVEVAMRVRYEDVVRLFRLPRFTTAATEFFNELFTSL